MAQYTIKHSCGHSATHQLFGKETDRKRTMGYRAKGVCPTCHKAESKPIKAYAGVSAGEASIRVENAYEIKDDLKAAGYKWDGTAWGWSAKAADKTVDAAKAVVRELRQHVLMIEKLGGKVDLSANLPQMFALLDA